MKKSLLSTLVIAASLVGLASCGGNTTSSISATPSTSVTPSTSATDVDTYVGTFSYEMNYGTIVTYGVSVSVGIKKDGKIAKVAITEESHNFTESWINDAGADAKAKWDEKIDAFLTSFEGRDASTVYNDIHGKVSFVRTSSGGMTITSIKDDANYTMASGATQSEGRLLAAIHNAIAEGTGKEKMVVVEYEDPTPVPPNTSTAA